MVDKAREHEISILTAYSMLQAFYYNYYQVQLVYITREGQLLKGPLLTEAPKLEEDLHLTVDNL